VSEPPRYRRYRAGPRLRRQPPLRTDPTLGGLRGGRGPGAPPRRRRISVGRVLAGLVLLVVGWLLLALVLFLISSHFRRTSPPGNVSAALDHAGSPLFSANNILVLGSDQRPKGSKEGGAFAQPSRSDVILLIRTGGGHSGRLSIPRDTAVNIPGHGLQKINAAFALGGPAEAIRVVKSYLGIPINHLVEVNFSNFPSLIDAMGGVTYSGGCVISNISGGTANGGFTLRLAPGTHHLDGQQALILARTRHNACNRNESDLTRVQRQQKLFQDMQHILASPSIFWRLPLVSWNAPPAIISDMGGPSLLQLFAGLAMGGSAQTRVLTPSGNITLPDGSSGLSVSSAERRAAAARFLGG
jgi:LCP family protein required for cell wall assembly